MVGEEKEVDDKQFSTCYCCNEETQNTCKVSFSILIPYFLFTLAVISWYFYEKRRLQKAFTDSVGISKMNNYLIVIIWIASRAVYFSLALAPGNKQQDSAMECLGNTIANWTIIISYVFLFQMSLIMGKVWLTSKYARQG